MPTFPGALWTAPTKIDGVDIIHADDVNLPANEIEAVESALGTNPQGAYTNVKTRLDSFVGAKIYSTVNQSLAAAGGFIPVQFNTARFDFVPPSLLPFWDVGTPNQLIIRVSGIYVLNASVLFSNETTNQRGLQIKNGSTTLARVFSPASANNALSVTCVWYCIVNQIITVEAYHNAGVGITLTAQSAFSPDLSIVRMGS